jgi:DNA-binding PadR family transcriptional regulator
LKRRREGRTPVTAEPLCPLVLAILAGGPRATGEVARRRSATDVPAHRAACVTLGRLRRAGLIYARPTADGRETFRLTTRGRREVALQRNLGRMAARFALGAIMSEARCARA